MNKLIAVARLTKPVELKYTSSGMAVAEMNLALDLGKTKNGEKETLFIKTSAFDKTAENCKKYLDTGSLISCEITIKNSNYEDKEGKKRYDYSFIANNINFLSTKKKEEEPNEEKTDIDKVYQDFGSNVELTDEDLSELAF